jgi:hypothetical protein
MNGTYPPEEITDLCRTPPSPYSASIRTAVHNRLSHPDDGRDARGKSSAGRAPEFGTYGQGSESANALAALAIAGAFFDATGKPACRIPLRPEYVKAMLAT